MHSGSKMVVLDSRPFDEYSRISIPSGINVPGAELVLRVHDIAPSPDTTIVVNCAGRTRSIIGAQSLINAGVPNKVVALRNGTMGWHLAGPHLRDGQVRSRAERIERGPRLGQGGGGKGRAQIRRHAHRPRHARAMAQGRHQDDDICLRRARPGRIQSRSPARRDLGARRATGAGDRHLCRRARRAHRLLRRQGRRAR